MGVNAHIPMNPSQDFILWGKTIYPILVSTCIGLLALAFFVMMWTGWSGWNVMRWSEKERQLEWSRLYSRRTSA